MKRKIVYLVSIFSLHALLAHSQYSRIVSGKVLDTAGKPVTKATISLYSPGAPDTLRTLSAIDGSFSFARAPQSSFFLSVSNLGYEKFERRYAYSTEVRRIVLENIILKNHFKLLQEVVITTPFIQLREDTVEYKADSFRVRPNAVVEDLLKKLPGIQVDKNGEITAQGKKVARVKVNGKDFFGNDPKTATKELPADIVDKVQVLDDYGELAAVSGIKDGDPEKVINLQLKKNKSKGIFGRVTAGYGTEKRYEVSGNLHQFNNNNQLSIFGNSNNINNIASGFGASMAQNSAMGRSMGQSRNNSPAVAMGGGNSELPNLLNNGALDGIITLHSFGTNFRSDFKNSKGSFYGSYTYSDRLNDGFRNISQQNFFEDDIFLNDQATRFVNKSQNHRAYLNIELKPDSFNYIKISPQLNYTSQRNRGFSDFNYQSKGIVTSEGYNGDSTFFTTPNLNLNILYNHRFRKRRRNFSINLLGGIAETETDNDKVNYTKNYNISDTTDFILQQHIMQDNSRRNHGIRVNYSEPIAKDRFLDVIYSYNKSYTKNDRSTKTTDSTGNEIENPALSNAFENIYVDQRAGLNFRTIKKKLNYTIGVSVQPVILTGYSITRDSSYSPQKRINVFPVARLAINFTRTKTLNFNYSGNARQPTFSQLQPVRDISNPQYQTQGNPSLKPEIAHNLNLYYNNFNVTSGRIFFSSLTVNLVKDQIVLNTIPIGNAGAQLTIPENVNGYYNLNGYYMYSLPFGDRKFVISFNGSINYNHNINFIDSLQNIGKSCLAMQGLNFELNLNEWLEWTSGLRYELNAVDYSIEEQPENDFRSWNFNSTMRLDLPGSLIFRYDFEYAINKGLSSFVSQNPYILNASIEKQFFRKKNGTIRVGAFDIFNQNTNISRLVTGNSITDMRTSRLGRFGMISFTYRLNRFQGQQRINRRETMAPRIDSH